MHFCAHYDFNTRAPTHATRFSLKSRKDCPGDHREDEPNSIAHAFLRVLRREHSRILARISTCTINSDLRLWRKRNSWATDTCTPAYILDAFRYNKSCSKAQISQHAKNTHPPTHLPAHRATRWGKYMRYLRYMSHIPNFSLHSL